MARNYHCVVCGHAITDDDPHTDEATGGDCHAECCEKCNPEPVGGRWVDIDRLILDAGSVCVFHGQDGNGTPVRVTLPHQAADDVVRILEERGECTALCEEWQVLNG